MDEQKEKISGREQQPEETTQQDWDEEEKDDLFDEDNGPQQGTWVFPKEQLIYIMVVIAVMCGGNGAGIVAAGLYWVRTHNLAGTIGIVVGVTAAALVAVLIIVLVHRRSARKKLAEKQKEQP